MKKENLLWKFPTHSSSDPFGQSWGRKWGPSVSSEHSWFPPGNERQSAGGSPSLSILEWLTHTVGPWQRAAMRWLLPRHWHWCNSVKVPEQFYKVQHTFWKLPTYMVLIGNVPRIDTWMYKGNLLADASLTKGTHRAFLECESRTQQVFCIHTAFL